MNWKLLLVMLLMNGCHAADILMLTVLGSRTHKIGLTPIAEELVRRGHNVTVVTTYQSEEPTPGVTEIVLKPDLAGQTSRYQIREYGQFLTTFMIYISYADWFKYFYDSMMENKQFRDLIDEKKVDLAIVDDSFNDYCLPVIDGLGVPFIFYSASSGYPSTWASMGASQELATVPNYFSSSDSVMNFKERLSNLVTVVTIAMIRNWYTIPTIDQYISKDLPNSRSILEIEKDASLCFINSKLATSWARPLPPSIIGLGPLHLRSVLPLPPEVLRFVEGSGRHGFVLFTLGSMKWSQQMPKKYLNAVMRTFARLPQRVVCKWHSHTKPNNLPSNVFMSTWLPQQDLLGHEKARLFITHGGLLGMQESTYHAVPLLVLPFATDYNINTTKAFQEGNGLKLQWADLNERTLYDAITTIINQPSFKGNATRLSLLMRDEQVSAKDTAAYWIEYVLRQNGTKHFKMSSQNMPFYQYYLLDVGVSMVALSIVILFGAFYILMLVLRVLCWLLFGSL